MQQFENQSYLNLETFRQNGEGVKTPVWFLLDGYTIYVRTGKDSWKVKRLAKNSRVRLAPCDRMGEPSGAWVEGTATVLHNGADAEAINKKFNQKYGLQKRFFDLLGRMQSNELVTLAITDIGQ